MVQERGSQAAAHLKAERMERVKRLGQVPERKELYRERPLLATAGM